jgi:ATP-dependent RNA helicase DDX54/DBP10
MLALKRKRTGGSGSNHSSDESTFSDQALSDNEIDISSALTGKRARIALVADENDDDDLQHFLQESISRRDVKAGTEIVKKAKGKGKVTKGEVGGGSFQSMGQSMMFNVVLCRRD